MHAYHRQVGGILDGQDMGKVWVQEQAERLAVAMHPDVHSQSGIVLIYQDFFDCLNMEDSSVHEAKFSLKHRAT